MILRLLLFALPVLSLVVYPEAEVFQAAVDDLPAVTLPTPKSFQNSYADDDPLPVIIWHGLGDSADAAGLKDVAKLISEVHPGTYVHIISVTEDVSKDKQATFFGNVTEQIEHVCETLAKNRILSTAPAVDAVGFSQGGQFLRGYIERCGHWAPPVRSLLTFGSQHNGIAEFQKCKGPSDWFCHAANAILKGSTVWSNYVQSSLVPAQYFRNPDDLENYIEYSNFLADINNERYEKNATYKKNLSKLEKFVMLLFEDDEVVIPKESAWFADKNATSGNVTHLKDRPIFKEDWIGLKSLEEKDALIFDTVKGGHMQLDEKDLKKLFGKYFGAAGKFKSKKSNVPDYDAWKLDL